MYRHLKYTATRHTTNKPALFTLQIVKMKRFLLQSVNLWIEVHFHFEKNVTVPA